MAALRHGLAVRAELGLDDAAALALGVTHVTGLADASAALAAELVRSGLALRPLGLHAILRRDLGGCRSGIVAGIAIEPRRRDGEGHDGGVLEAAMLAAGNVNRHRELDARTLGEIDRRVRALIGGAAARATPRRREGDRAGREAELLAHLDRTLVGIGTHIGEGHHIVAAVAGAGDFAVALRHLGGLQVGRIAGDDRCAVRQQPEQEGVGLGRVGVIAGEVVFIGSDRRGEREGIGHHAAGALERGERRRDRDRHGQ